MPGGAYTALSGMQSRLDALDRLASDIANLDTAGYKSARASDYAAARDFDATLQSAVDVSHGATRTDFSPGTITNTGGDLDVAIDGKGFFAVQSEGVVRYTRSGNFTRRTDGVLTTVRGEPVLDAQMKPIKLGPGALAIEPDGAVTVAGAPSGRIARWQFEDRDLVRDGGALFRAAPGVTPQPSDAPLVPKALEKANIAMADRMTALVEVSRSFEALQRGISVLMNDIDGRAVTELGKR